MSPDRMFLEVLLPFRIFLGKRDVSDILSTAALKSMQRISSQGRRT